MKRDRIANLQNEIDRLVGGDLENSELRETLSQLDTEVDGWKRCALSFIEAQSWQRAFRSLADDDRAAATTTADSATPSVSYRRRKVAAAAMIAAAFLFGIGAAWMWQQWLGASMAPQNRIAEEKKNLAPKKDEAPAPKKAVKIRAEPGVFGVVQVTENGVTETVFPIVRTDKDEIVAVNLTANEITEYDVRLLERKGYEIEQHRKMVSVRFLDGKSFQFPVDWVQYRFIGHRVY